MSDTVSHSAEIAARYATAIFDLAKEMKNIPALAKDVIALEDALAGSVDFSAMIASPIYSREEQASAIGALASGMNLSDMMGKALMLMAQKRRLFVLSALLTQLKRLIAEEKGEATAEVTSAVKLSAAQKDALAKSLSEKVGKKVQIDASVDKDLIGGMIVKVGSRMIDSSIRSKLANLENAMKEVG
ncbi:MAG: F0F1 ATP synthase subunit delta [Pseudomonadota bacterium]